jgi:nitronate monooxygenase
MGGVATRDLAAAVASAGGLGMLGGVRLSAPVLVQTLDELARQTGGTFGVNFLMPFLDRACVEVAARKAKVVEFFFGEPDAELVQTVHDGGALACWQVGSVEEARAAAGAGCDFVVVQGVEAGGHVRGRTGLLSLLPEVIEAVSVPVVAAGGIGTAQAMAAALAMGADGVRVGTRFVAAEESAAHPFYKEALVRAGAGDTVLTEAFSANWPGAPHRVLRACVEAAQSFTDEFTGELDLGGQKMPLPRLATPCPTRTTTGHFAAMALYAGETVGAVHAIEPAAVIVRELSEGAEAMLRRWGAS